MLSQARRGLGGAGVALADPGVGNRVHVYERRLTVGEKNNQKDYLVHKTSGITRQVAECIRLQ
ncbi:hypothetical protein CASFOL_038910 [Castilleja foliolosa]|uniref:Uncharacterized protein n=1 Tax=Castilleja foliolosa TaxID=1961234 RepID=A0ABD3BIY1_9LAMI